MSEIEIFRSHMTSITENVKDISDAAWIPEQQTSACPIANRAYCLALTAQVTVANDERTFSKFKLVKILCRSTMDEQRLEEILMMACERDIIDDISVSHIGYGLGSFETKAHCEIVG